MPVNSIKRYREEAGLTLGAVAARADLSVSYLSEVERGLKKPSPKTVRKIAAALRVSPALLLGEEPALPPLVPDSEEAQAGLAPLPPDVRTALDNPGVRELLLSVCSLPERDINFLLDIVRLYRRSFGRDE